VGEWEKAVKEWEKNGKEGKKPSKPTQQKELPPLEKEELDELPILPINWAWCRNLNVSTKITDGEHITPKREMSGYYLLSARNIQNGYISYSNVDYVGEDEYLRIRKRCNPEFGDILISCSGSVGRVSLVPKKSNFVMVRSVALVKTNLKIYKPKFLEYLFLSPILQSQIEEGKKATAQANLFLEPIGKLNVIICSLEEQQQIVLEIESRLSVCDKLEENIRESLEKAKALRQSILKKAFEGALLTEAELQLCRAAEDYMPAAQLLEQVKQSK
jgi:type I restriction enzyme S subunit